MSSEDYGTESVDTGKEYRTESVDTTKSSEFVQGSDIDEPTETIIFPLSDIEKEIEDEHYDDFKTQVEVLVEIGKKPLKPLELSDCFPSDRPGMYLEILPKIIFESVDSDTSFEEIDFPKPIFRLTIDQGTIATVEHESSSAQTLRSKLLNSWSQYEPRIFSEKECFSTIESESFSNFLKTAEKGILESLVENKTADSFSRELDSLFRDEKDLGASKESALTISASFVCSERYEKHVIRSICWHPIFKDIFIASTLRSLKFEERTSSLLEAESYSFTSLIWSCKNQFTPKVILDYIDDVVLHKFNPSMPNIIVCGTFSGQLVLWNLKLEELLADISTEDNSSYYADLDSAPSVLHHSVSSNAENNHIRGITDLEWIPNHIEIVARGSAKLNMSRDSFQLVTCGLDGYLKFWDLRPGFQCKPGFSIAKMFRQLDGKWEPFHSVLLILEYGKKILSMTRFALRESTKVVELEEELSDEERRKKEKKISTEFYAGCDDGTVFCGNFTLNRDDAGKFLPFPPQLYASTHSGPITAIAISPFISDIFLSTGSKTVAIWKHDIKRSPIFSQDLHAYITSAEWSNTRPAVFILGFEDGSIQIWDLLHSIYEPFLMHFICTTALTVISVQSMAEEEYIVAVGDSEGTVYNLTLSSIVWKPWDNELALMGEFVTKKASQIQSTETQKQVKKTDISNEKDIEIKSTKAETTTDKMLQKNYEDFLELQQIQLKYLGIIKEEQTDGNE